MFSAGQGNYPLPGCACIFSGGFPFLPECEAGQVKITALREAPEFERQSPCRLCLFHPKPDEPEPIRLRRTRQDAKFIIIITFASLAALRENFLSESEQTLDIR